MKKEFREALENSPVICAIKDDDGLARCKNADCQMVFILYGDLVTIPDIVAAVKEAGKLAMVHLDLIQGLGQKEIAVDFIKKYTKADGIITTKPALVHRARELSLYTVLRFFVIDSLAYSNIEKQLKTARPDVIEILPALMPKVLKKICKLSNAPVIAGGLVSEKSDILELLDVGVTSVSSTNPEVWEL